MRGSWGAFLDKEIEKGEISKCVRKLKKIRLMVVME